jgi:hypothetical protein
MHERAIAERNATATALAQSAAEVLAERYGLPTPTLKVGVGPAGLEVARLREREAVAEFLGQLANIVEFSVPPRRADMLDVMPVAAKSKAKG